MKKIKYLVALILLLAPVAAWAAFDTVTHDGGSQIYLTGTGKNYTVGNSTRVEEYTVNASTIDFSVSKGSSISLTSADKSNFTYSATSCGDISISCGTNSSVLYIECGPTAVAHTITITPSGTCSGSTGGASSGSGPGGGGAGSSVTKPSLPTIAPVISQAVVENTYSVGVAVSVSVGGFSHTVTVQMATANEVRAKIASEPITVTLKKNESTEVDTNGDGQKDLKVAYLGLVDGKPKLQFTNLTDEGELKNAVTINYGAYETDSHNVVLKLNAITNAAQVAVSNKNDFTGVAFTVYKNTIPWTLTAGDGVKTVYARFKSSTAGTSDASDTIKLVKQGFKEETVKETKAVSCSLTIGQAYKSSDSPAVYYITDKCEKRVFNKANVFFTYFTSWKDVKSVAKDQLKAMKNDTLGFMPWGPKYDPKYGALVKIVTDPKVYLLLGGEKYWITDEAVFNKLSYKWNWIEDIDKALLDKYTIGSEISYIDRHPNYTLVKYAKSAKVYRLEPDPKDSAKQVKRHIADEKTFNKLNFRWDRIVTVADTEKYTDGEQLTQ